MFGFTFIMGDDRLKTGYGLTVRDDWCRQLDLDVTQIDTPEEFHDMLSRFKKELNLIWNYAKAYRLLFLLNDATVATANPMINTVTTTKIITIAGIRILSAPDSDFALSSTPPEVWTEDASSSV